MLVKKMKMQIAIVIQLKMFIIHGKKEDKMIF